MFVRVEEIIEQDEFQTQHGTLCGWKFRAVDENNNECFLGINTKPGRALTPGTEFDFEPSGKVVGVYTLGKRAQNQGTGPNPYGGGPQRSPQRPATSGTPQRPQAPSGHANAPQPPSRPVPTESQAVAAFKRINAALGVTGDSGQATTIFLGLLRGDIRRDPSPADLAAEQAAKQAEAERAAAEAQRVAEEAAQKLAAAQAVATMPPMSPEVQGFGSDDVPF